MTVGQLIEELQKFPKDSEISVKSYSETFNELTLEGGKKYPYIYVRYIDEYGNYLH